MAPAGRRVDVREPGIEHRREMVSADSDFARFSELRWTNPFRR